MRFTITTYEELKIAEEKLCQALIAVGVSAERAFECRLIAHELIGNVLQHSACKAFFSAEWTKEQLLLTVRGEVAYIPPEESVCPPCEAERGRGLYLVDAVSVERAVTEEGGISVRIRIEK